MVLAYGIERHVVTLKQTLTSGMSAGKLAISLACFSFVSKAWLSCWIKPHDRQRGRLPRCHAHKEVLIQP